MAGYRIAELNLDMIAADPRLLRQGKIYRRDFTASPDIVVHASPEKIAAIHRTYPHLSPNDCEYLETGSIFYRALIDQGGLMIHSSAVALDGIGYLFSGPCGVGKSTHARLWLRRFGRRAMIVNDDKPAIRVRNGRVFIYGTPWSGKSALNANVRVPLGGIVLLEQGPKNIASPAKKNDAVFFLLNQTFRPIDQRKMEAVLALLDTILQTVPVFRLRCRPDLDAVRLAASTLARKEILS